MERLDTITRRVLADLRDRMDGKGVGAVEAPTRVERGVEASARGGSVLGHAASPKGRMAARKETPADGSRTHVSRVGP